MRVEVSNVDTALEWVRYHCSDKPVLSKEKYVASLLAAEIERIRIEDVQKELSELRAKVRQMVFDEQINRETRKRKTEALGMIDKLSEDNIKLRTALKAILGIADEFYSELPDIVKDVFDLKQECEAGVKHD